MQWQRSYCHHLVLLQIALVVVEEIWMLLLLHASRLKMTWFNEVLCLFVVVVNNVVW
jgi:hypothetical protein